MKKNTEKINLTISLIIAEFAQSANTSLYTRSNKMLHKRNTQKRRFNEQQPISARFFFLS